MSNLVHGAEWQNLPSRGRPTLAYQPYSIKAGRRQRDPADSIVPKMRVAVLPKMRVAVLPKMRVTAPAMPLPFSGNSIGEPRLRATEPRRYLHFGKYAPRTRETDPDSHRNAVSEPARTETTRIV